jgi:hypothetical protein
MNKFTDEYLANLAAMSESERGELSIGEKRALTRYLKRIRQENAIHPDLTPSGEKRLSDLPATPAPAVQQADEIESQYSRTVKGMDWVADWPESLIGPYHPTSKWADPAQALQEFPGRIARLAKGMRRRSAMTLRHSIMTAKIKSFAPAGSYRAEAAIDMDGTYSVYAAYVGESK